MIPIDEKNQIDQFINLFCSNHNWVAELGRMVCLFSFLWKGIKDESTSLQWWRSWRVSWKRNWNCRLPKSCMSRFFSLVFRPILLTLISFQRVFLTGNNGVHGLNVQPRVAWGPRFEHVLAVTQISEEIRLVLVTPPRQKIVLQLHVKVAPCYMEKPNFKGNITVEIW